MDRIYHIVPKPAWDALPAGPYRADSLQTEGFIHCSNRDQVARIANLFYADQPELLVLHIDVSRLFSPVRHEDPGTGELFPHVYGPLDRDAIIAVTPLPHDADGHWTFPTESP